MSRQLTAAQKKAIAAKKKAKKPPMMQMVGHGAYAVRPRRQVRARRRVVKGHGDYKSSVGYQIGSSIGGALGYGAQHLIKFLTGFGDYRVSSNSLMGGTYDPPELRNLRDRGVVVRHREYIADITATSAFTLQSYAINPGLPGSFPWLAQVAEAFEEYYITGMVFEYKTLSADYTTASSAALGYVVMATQYNVFNPVFPDKKTMENYEFSNSGKPSESFIHPIECKKSITPVSELYVRTGAVPSGADQRLYDLGSFQIATGGNSGSGVLGELWVTFEIVLCKPKLIETIGYELATDHYHTATGIGNANPLGTVKTLAPGSNLGTTIGGNNDNIIVFPASVTDGNYMIVYQVTGDSTACTAPALSGSGYTALTVWKQDTSNNLSNTATTTTTYINSVVINITAGSANVTFGLAGTLPANATSMDIWITQVNGAIIS